MTQWAYTPINLHSGHHPRYLLHTNCIASFPLLCAQWAHTSLLYDNVGLCPPHILSQGAPFSPSTVHRLSSLISSLICTVGPCLLIYDTVGLCPLIFLHIGHHPRHLLYTDCPASASYTPSFFCTEDTSLTIYCTQSVQSQFLPSW